MQRLAVLYTELAGYTAAGLKTLQETHGTELLVIRWPQVSDAPFDDRYFDWIDQLFDRDSVSIRDMKQMVGDFEPDAVFMAGWADSGYLQVARTMRRRDVIVVSGSDKQWTGSWRQQGARLIAPWYLHSAIDVLWVPGERQRQLARRLGYRGAQCWDGYYTCDWDRFAKCHAKRQSPPRVFLFIGRYVREKGIDLLIDAYGRYRDQMANPWPLVCAGSGPLDEMLEEQRGVENKGFVQPDALPDLMEDTGVLLLPSRDEPWGVVVEEAAAAGLPLICSEACGSAVHLLQDRYNGYLTQTGSADHLARCMVAMSTLSDEDRRRMSTRSHELSKQYTPTRWTDTLISGVNDWYANDRSQKSTVA